MQERWWDRDFYAERAARPPVFTAIHTNGVMFLIAPIDPEPGVVEKALYEMNRPKNVRSS